MPSNYVEIAIKARDDAKPPLDDLKLALDALSHKVSTALAEVDDKEAEAKLLALNAKLDQIGRKVASPRITVAGADKAVADLAAVDVALDKVGGKGTEAGVAMRDLRDTGLDLDQALIGSRSALDDYHAKMSGLSLLLRDTDQGAADAAVSLESLGPPVAQAGEEAGMALPSLQGLNPAMAGMASAVAAAVPVVIGAGTSLAAMGAGAAAAYPQIKQVMGILSGTERAPSSGPIAQAVSGIRDLESAYKQFSSQSGVGDNLISKALPSGIEAVENVLRDMTPLAHAGAVSIDEIAAAGDRVTSSSGFKGFLGDLAKQAPEDTGAILNLAGAVGGDLEKAFEAAGPHIGAALGQMTGLAGTMSGPLAGAVSGTVQGVGVLSGVLGGLVGAASETADGLTSIYQAASGHGALDAQRSIQGAAHATDSWHSALSAARQPDVLSFFGALTGNFSDAKAGALGAGNAIAKQSEEAKKAAAEAGSFGSQMDIASGSAGTLTDRVTALETALSKEGDATDGALGSIVSFHQQLLTTEQAMQASGDKAGYMTAKSLAAAAAFVALYTNAEKASASILGQTHSAELAAGPLIAMRDQLEKIQDPTAAEAALLGKVNAEIAALKSKTVTIGVQVVDESGGVGSQPLPVTGGSGGRIQGGPAGQVAKPQGMTPDLLPPPGTTEESPAYAAMAKYAASVKQSVLQDATLANVQAAAGTHKIGGKAYLTGLEGYLGKINKFNEAIKKLANEGLDRQLLAQIITEFQSDPDSGLQIAEALLNGPLSRIHNLNKTEREIENASGRLGKTAGRTQFAVGGLGRHHGAVPLLNGSLAITLDAGASDGLMREFVRALRIKIRDDGGGGPNSVQIALGQSA